MQRLLDWLFRRNDVGPSLEKYRTIVPKNPLPNASSDYAQGFSDGAHAARSIDGYVNTHTGFKYMDTFIDEWVKNIDRHIAAMNHLKAAIQRTAGKEDVSSRDIGGFLKSKRGEAYDVASYDAAIRASGIQHAQSLFKERREQQGHTDQTETKAG